MLVNRESTPATAAAKAGMDETTARKYRRLRPPIFEMSQKLCPRARPRRPRTRSSAVRRTLLTVDLDTPTLLVLTIVLGSRRHAKMTRN